MAADRVGSGDLSSARAMRMEARIGRTAVGAGVTAAGVSHLLRALRAGMAPRLSGPAALASDHDPAYLHPGRTVLVLLGDLVESDPDVLAVGALAESRSRTLKVLDPDARKILEAEGYQRWCVLPAIDWSPEGGAADDRLLEQLVTAEEPVQRVALAEALDQLRHAHLWPAASERARACVLAKEVLAPVAARVHPVLDRRFNWWIRRVANGLRFERE